MWLVWFGGGFGCCRSLYVGGWVCALRGVWFCISVFGLDGGLWLRLWLFGALGGWILWVGSGYFLVAWIS